jgi:HEAT repeat protein
MFKGYKGWMTAGLVVVATGGGALVVRHYRAEQQRAAGESTSRGLGAEAVAPPTFPAVPETPEAIAEEVAASLAAWRQAILVRDADTVVRLDRTFLNATQRYGAALVESAKHESDERVRAFSTRVLGKQKNAALADLFESLLADKSPFVRQNAAWALGELAADADGRVAARRAVAELRHARSKDPAADVRSAAKGALARLE